jgi:hypothetical protein
MAAAGGKPRISAGGAQPADAAPAVPRPAAAPQVTHQPCPLVRSPAVLYRCPDCLMIAEGRALLNRALVLRLRLPAARSPWLGWRVDHAAGRRAGRQRGCSANRRGVTLELQQPGMARRAANTSRSQGGRQRQISWRVEWHFPGAGVTVDDRRLGTRCCRFVQVSACHLATPLMTSVCTWQQSLLPS